ncbi:MAG: glycosyltransferase [Alistipes sp.]|nr:glycosyltransferase [Alistipes sp.]
MSKRVLCIIDTFRIGGGAQTQLAGLCVMLKQHNYDVYALSYHKVDDKDSLSPYLRENGIITSCLSKATNMWSKFQGVKKKIAQVNPDTVIAYIDGPTIICSAIKALGGKFRLIVSERNVTQKLTLHERIKFWMYRYADLIVPNAHTQAKFISKHYTKLSKKVRTISNFVDTTKFKFRSINFNTNKRLEILVVARINPQKNLITFLKTINILKNIGLDFHIDWYGKKDRDYFLMCCDKVNEFGLSEYICFHDAIKDINNIYCNLKYDVFCLPSLFEGCPNTLAEAMASGLPILCSDVCDNSKYVEGNGILFDPLNATSIAGAIIEYAQLSTEKKQNMGRISRERAEKYLSTENFIRNYKEII